MTKKLTKVEISRFKGISGTAKFSVNGMVFYITGRNGSGKTSVIDAIYTALTGNCRGLLKKDRWKLINGSGPASVSVTLHDSALNLDITITRKITKSKHELEITASDGKKIDATYIERLLHEYTYDVSEFLNKPPTEQARLLNIDTAAVDRKIKDAKENLSIANKEKLNADKKVNNFDEEIDRSAKRINVIEVTKKISETEEINRKRAAFILDIETCGYQIKTAESEKEDYRKKLKECSQRIADAETEQERLKAVIDGLIPQSETNKIIESEKEKIQEAETHNAKVEAGERYKRLEQEAETSRSEWESKKETVKTLETERAEYLQSVKLPLDSAQIDHNGGLLIKCADGEYRPLNENFHNTASALKIAIELLQKCQAPELPLYFIKYGGLFDRDKTGGIPALEQLQKETNAQFIIEIVTEERAGENSILMEEKITS